LHGYQFQLVSLLAAAAQLNVLPLSLLLLLLLLRSICIYMAANISGGHLNPAVTMR
jgi:glycerol uptake facilitator-like aquaporin